MLGFRIFIENLVTLLLISISCCVWFSNDDTEYELLIASFPYPSSLGGKKKIKISPNYDENDLNFFSLIIHLCIQISTREGLISFSMEELTFITLSQSVLTEEKEMQCSLKVIS